MVTSHKYEHDEDERRSALSWTFWLLPLGYDFITLFFEALLWTTPVPDTVYFIAAPSFWLATRIGLIIGRSFSDYANGNMGHYSVWRNQSELWVRFKLDYGYQLVSIALTDFIVCVILAIKLHIPFGQTTLFADILKAIL